MMFLGLGKDNEYYCLSVPTSKKPKSVFKVFNQYSFQFGTNIIIKSAHSVKLLGIVIDDKINFNMHIDDLCSKAKSSVSALQRISHFTDLDSLKLLIETYFISCFSYYPIIWMFCSKAKNKKINALHKKELRLITPGVHSFDDLLQINKMIDIHSRNTQFLIEVFHCVNKLNPSFLWDEVIVNERYISKRNGLQLVLPKTKLENGRKTLSFRGSILWNYLPKRYKSLSLKGFKKEVKELQKTRCKCHLCNV